MANKETENFDPEPFKIRTFLSDNGNFRLKIPDYQRNYVWKPNEQVAEFWDDLYDQFTSAQENSADNSLFLGNIILCEEDGENIKNTFKYGYHIVDGQQRITTIFILLLAFRSWLHIFQDKSSEEVKKEIKSHVSTITTRINDILFYQNQDTFEKTGERLTAGAYVDRLFQLISDKDWTHEQGFPERDKKGSLIAQKNRLKPIYDHFDQGLNDVLNKDNFVLFNSVIQSLSFTVIKLKTMESAFTFFERTNSRGKDLEVGDLLKAHLFGNHPDSQIIIPIWQNIINNSNSTLTRMLKYFYISKHGHITSSKLFNGLKTMITPNKNEKEKQDKNEKISIFITELEEFSQFYNALHKKQLNNFEDVRSILKRIMKTDTDRTNHTIERTELMFHALDGLNLFGITQTIAITWAFLNCFYRLELDLNEAREEHKNTLVIFLENLENYHFINNYIGVNVTNEVEKFYGTYAKNFSSCKNKDSFKTLLKDFYSQLQTGERSQGKGKAGLDDLNTFTAGFVRLNYREDKYKLYYVLDRFNNYLTKPKGEFKKTTQNMRVAIYTKTSDYPDRSHEHWYPKDPSRFENKEAPLWVHKVGNILAASVDTNNAIGNKLPSDKLDYLNEHPTLMPHKYNHTMDFLKNEAPFDDWGEKRVLERAETMAKKAYEIIWKFNNPYK